jgi:hypothetical protein
MNTVLTALIIIQNGLKKGEGILIWTQQNKFSLYDDESRLNQPPPANIGW